MQDLHLRYMHGPAQDLALLTADAPQSWLQPGVDLTLPGIVPAANAITRRGGLQVCHQQTPHACTHACALF